MTLTCEHCDSEIDVAADPRCVVYEPSGRTDVVCADCRDRISQRWPFTVLRIKRGWQA